jgi:hypothetical protein
VDKLTLLNMLPKHKWRILAVTVFLAIFSPVVAVTYLSNREQPLYMDDDQWSLGVEDAYESATNLPTRINEMFPKYYKVVLDSIDDMQGTAHLRADLRMRTPDGKGLPLLNYIPERLKTSQTRQNPVPVELLFGRFTIRDEWESFPHFGSIHPESLGKGHPAGGPRTILPSSTRANFSESAPTSTQADVSLDGIPWWYPFDEYLIAARVDCVVFATPDREEYFRILSDGYTLASKLPNFIVRNVNAKDVENWLKSTQPEIKNKELKESTKLYRADFWRDGVILLVLKRPLFPRFLAVFFSIVALAWVVVVARASDPKQLSLNVFGYFLAIWAIRAPLAAGAPTGPLFIDYATLGLYAFLIAVVTARLIWIRKT